MQGDYAWVPSLTILQIILLGVFILSGIVIWRVLPRFIQKKAEVAMSNISANKEVLLEETGLQIKSFGNALHRIEDAITGHDTTLKELEKTVNGQTHTINITSKQTLENQIYNANIPRLKRLKALRNYLAMGGNGNGMEFGMKELILPEKSLWLEVLDDTDDYIVIDPVHFEKVLKEIKERIHY